MEMHTADAVTITVIPVGKDSSERIQQAFHPSKRLHTCNMAACAKSIIVSGHPKRLNFLWGIYKGFSHLAVKLVQRQCRRLHLKFHACTLLMFMCDRFIAQLQDKSGYFSHGHNHT
ncbi:hypothetical protein [Xylella taiwanensis]|uniref:hypothetical protein n=1 Tax=Xylella taiwanensis TaxID=1444770 RepID=UPI00135F19BC|nr:hypothetical protein [Xylella taiwanensis]